MNEVQVDAYRTIDRLARLDPKLDGLPIAAWMLERREEGMSDERIAAELLMRTDGDVEITRNTVSAYIERGLKEGHTVGHVDANDDAGAAA